MIQADDPVIVFDPHISEANSDAPIELGIRQPSFTTLSDHQLIPKGSNSMNDFTPILDVVEPFPEPIIEEKDSDPNVLLVQEMSYKNSERWSKMGYVPPENLIPLVRAASQSIFQPKQIISQELQKNHSLILNLISEADENNTSPNKNVKSVNDSKNITDINESEEESQKLDSPSLLHLKHSRSFGTLPGQGIEDKQALIMPINDQINESTPQNEQIPLEKVNNSLSTDQFAGKLYPLNASSTSKDDELFGHLNELVTEPKSSLQYSILLTGEIPEEACDQFESLTKIFEKYQKICQDNQWTEESEYLSDIINILNSAIYCEEEEIECEEDNSQTNE